MILALISILLFGSIVWSHHMFTVNLETDTNLYFTILTLIIAIPTGTKLYNWLYVTASSTSTPALPTAGAQSTGTSTHLLLAYVFLLLVIQGGVTGVVLGNNVLDLQLHDTYYVVSHFHFILSVATVVSIVLTVSTLSTSINAYRLAPVLACEALRSSALSAYSISTAFIMLNTVFLPMYYLGFNTMPRRIAEYSDYLSSWNSVSSISVITFYTATLLALLA